MRNLLITNTPERTLGQRLRELISSSNSMRALVGFFYFSGVKVIYDSLRDNPAIKLRILVGMEADLYAGRLQELIIDRGDRGREEQQEAYIESLRRVVQSAELDKQGFYERVHLFVELIREGRLILRKTRSPNHAKLYLFEMKEEHKKVRSGVWVSGSSNLTLPGLESNGELNLDLSDFGYGEASDYFEELWKESIPLTEDEEVRERILHLIEEQSIVAEVTPFEAYLLVLKTYVELRQLGDNSARVERILAEAGFTRYKYQVDAVNQAVATLKAYNGVIVADVVGLGKTVIACLIARLRGKRGLVIAPPGLVGDEGASTGWKGYLRRFKLYDWEARSCGKLSEIREYVARDGDFDMVIIDEAHRFRNQGTSDYDDLLQICRNKEVILLTATPFNNKPADLLALLKLFVSPRNCDLVLDGNLEEEFNIYGGIFKAINFILKNMTNSEKTDSVEKTMASIGIHIVVAPRNYNAIKQALSKHAAKLACSMRAVIEPVTIRRNRLDLKGNPDYASEITTLSNVRPPVEQFYYLSEEQNQFYDSVITRYFGPDGFFHGAIYRPVQYDMTDEGDEAQQINMYWFIRNLLVRRFESSFGAFAKTLERVIWMHERVKIFAQEHQMLLINRKLMDKVLATDDDDEQEELLIEIIAELQSGARRQGQQIYRFNEYFDSERFFRDLDADIDLLKQVRLEMQKLQLCENDPKAQQLVEMVRDVLGNKCKSIKGKDKRKVLIFSEFADTVSHVKGYLEAAFPKEVLVINKGLTKANLKEIKDNFNAFVGDDKQKDNYQILLATDRLSEGHDLNRAGLVINYDIPWNPTRVIQRVGRINRIGKKVFDELYIFNYFPTVKGADIHRSRQIASEKMFLIHSTIGEDAQILSADEEPTPSKLFQHVNSDPDEQEGESFFTKALRELRRLVKEHPEMVERISGLPARIKTAARRQPEGVYLFQQRGAVLFALSSKSEQVVPITIEEGLESIRCTPEEPRVDFSGKFWDSYSELCAFELERERESKSTQSWRAQARNQISNLLEKLTERDREFADVVLEDIQYFGTLSEHTLRSIAKIDASSEAGENSLLEIIKQLKQELGKNYLKPYKERVSKESIIVTVEHKD